MRCGQVPSAKQPKLLIVTDHHTHLPAGRCTVARRIVFFSGEDVAY